MTARPTRPWRLIPIGLWLAAAAAVSVPARPVAAADEDLLGQQIADAALVPRGEGVSADLLTLDAEDDGPVVATLALLRRGAAGWSVVDQTAVPIAQPSDQANPPWLVDLGDGRFAILAASQNSPLTVIVQVTVDGRGAGPTFSVGEPAIFEGNLSQAGAADVDGDGTKELIISRWIDGDDEGRCTDTAMSVFRRAGSELQQTEMTIKLGGVKAIRMEGGAFGEFDGRPGDDMIAHVYDTCQVSDDGTEPHYLVGIRLADGSIIEGLPSTAGTVPMTSTPPLVLDVDGDGRDEAVVRGAYGFALIDPTNDWARLEIHVGDAPPLAVRDGSQGSRPAVVTWVAPLYAPGAVVWSTRIERIGGSLVTVGTTSTPFPDLPPDTVGSEPGWPLFSPYIGGPAIAPAIDLDQDGCPELIMPAATADCLGTGAVRPGPAWMNSQPLGVVGTSDDPGLLVAEGLEWYPYQDGPYPPIPSAAARGALRGGWVQPFFLAEVALPLAGSDAPVPAPVVDPLTDGLGRIDLDGPVATRLLLRVSPLRTYDTAIEGPRPLVQFMRTEPTESELILLRRLPPSNEVGTLSAMSRLQFSIRSEVTAAFEIEGDDRWSVSAVALDARGVPSVVTRKTVIYDAVAPVLTLDEAPLLSPPWPFEATIRGTSEPGAIVRLAGGPEVVADGTGAFALTTHLAPWPQTIEAVAVDASGNRTPASLSVMGGIDLRGFPWPAIAAVAILIAVLLSSLRGTKRVRRVPSVAVYGDDGGDLVIEELDPGSRYRRD